MLVRGEGGMFLVRIDHESLGREANPLKLVGYLLHCIVLCFLPIQWTNKPHVHWRTGVLFPCLCVVALFVCSFQQVS